MKDHLDKIEHLLDEVQTLMDNPNGSLAAILRRAARLAVLTGDNEHRDLFRFHIEGLGYSKTDSPKHAPWNDPTWKPRWNVRQALIEDRMLDDDKVMSFSIEELEHSFSSLGEERLEAKANGNAKLELQYYDLEASARKIFIRIRRRVDIFLQLTSSWLLSQREVFMAGETVRPMGSAIFIGHGRSPAWRDLKDFLSERLRLPVVEFNSEPVAGQTTVARLSEMLDASTIAFLVLTGEDEHADSVKHARENVVHEVGLFQGRLGFTRAIVLLEDGCAEFSNISGLSQIRFPSGNILAKSEEIRRVLEREGVLPSRNAP